MILSSARPHLRVPGTGVSAPLARCQRPPPEVPVSAPITARGNGHHNLRPGRRVPAIEWRHQHGTPRRRRDIRIPRTPCRAWWPVPSQSLRALTRPLLPLTLYTKLTKDRARRRSARASACSPQAVCSLEQIAPLRRTKLRTTTTRRSRRPLHHCYRYDPQGSRDTSETPANGWAVWPSGRSAARATSTELTGSPGACWRRRAMATRHGRKSHREVGESARGAPSGWR